MSNKPISDADLIAAIDSLKDVLLLLNSNLEIYFFGILGVFCGFFIVYSLLKNM
jgi:hypothetical protein